MINEPAKEERRDKTNKKGKNDNDPVNQMKMHALSPPGAWDEGLISRLDYPRAGN